MSKNPQIKPLDAQISTVPPLEKTGIEIKNIGIVRYGAYLPKYALKREQIAQAWDFPVVPGNISVPNHDEDTITMAVEAGLDCLGLLKPQIVDGLYFATTTPPYTEKQCVTVIATALDLRTDIMTMDETGTTRALSIALARAYETIKSSKAHFILVIGADMQQPMPESMFEYQYGAGSVAFLIGDRDVVINIEAYTSIADNVIGPYKRNIDTFVRQFEPKHEATHGFNTNLPAVLKKILDENRIPPKSVKKVALYSPDPRAGTAIGEKLGFSSQSIEESLFLETGNTGNAFGAMALINALRRGKAGDLVVFGSYGDGADAFLFKIMDKAALVGLRRGCRGVTKHLNSMVILPNYTQSLAKRKILEKDRFTRKSSPVRIWREEKFLTRLYGMKCHRCGVIQYPIWRACIECGAKDENEEIKLARTGKVFTFTLDHLVGGDYYATPVPRCVIDLDGGGRLLCDMTDVERPTEEVKIGMTVELTFRWVHPGANFQNYYWKCRPVRVSATLTEEGDV
jgi:3-hydroxy-3-methylglutaryl CoA synthase